jgi:hypothetical protein
MASDPHIPTPAGQPASKTEQLYAALDGIPADEPRNYLRQSLQLLLPLLEELQHRVESLEVRLAGLEDRAATTRVRKRRLTDHLAGPVPQGREKDLAAIATVLVTSEAAGHPIEHVFDQHRGPGGSRWMAAEPGEQIVRLAFDTPQSIHQITVEVEEPEVSRTQELQLAISSDGGRTYREVLRQEYTFSPPGTAFEHEEWTIAAEGVTHVQLVIKPDKGHTPCRATLTTLACR